MASTSGILLLFAPFLVFFGMVIWLLSRGKKKGRIPMLATAGQSCRLAWKHYPQFLALAWGWLVLIAPVLFLLARLQLPAHAAQCSEGALEHIRNGSLSACGLAITAVSGVAGSSIAVAWHRLVLRNEPVGGQVYLRLDALVVRYIAAAAMLVILGMLPDMIGAWMQTRADYADSFTQELATGALAIIVSPFVARLPVLLPARALGLDTGFGDAWRRTRGNFTCLAWGQTLCLVPFFLLCLPFSFLSASAGCAHLQLSALASTISQLLMIFIAAPVYLCFLSLSYRFFFEKDASPLPQIAR